jgi:hypothetical protein
MRNVNKQPVSDDQYHRLPIFKNERLHRSAANFGWAAEGAVRKIQTEMFAALLQSLPALTKLLRSGHTG